MTDCLADIERDLRVGVNAILHSPVGRLLQKPLNTVEDIVLDMDGKEEVVRILNIDKSEMRRHAGQVQKVRESARLEGRKVARRLETLKEEIRRKARLQTSGALDRKRFKRALAGAETIYNQNRLSDITSLAVSIQLDMSGSMFGPITEGTLAGTTLALEEALQRLEAEYMVSGFGSQCALIKTFGDRNISDEQAAVMMSRDLGGTQAAAGMRLSLLGLKEAKSANKLHVMMTDGELGDRDEAIKEAQEMRKNGILPFGIFFGKDAPDSMNEIFGEGGWVKIERLSDLSEVVARRIEQIYRKILATR
jgi:nitric oxide reductase activation protein